MITVFQQSGTKTEVEEEEEEKSTPDRLSDDEWMNPDFGADLFVRGTKNPAYLKWQIKINK